MAEQQIYDETMLDIAPMLDEFPMDEFDNDLLSPMLQEQDQLGFHQDGQIVIPSYGEFIDPDMFLNGVVKRESESDCSSSSRRNTPSPSDSHQSYESYPSSGYGSCQSNNPVSNILLDSPPVSPENPSQTPPHIVTVPTPNVVRVGTAQLPTVQKPSCGTNLADLKKIKLPPRGSITKKTIVLTAKDYQALVRNMKNQPNNGTIFIKATPASAFAMAAKDKPVLPKPAIVPQQTDPPPVVTRAQPPPPQTAVPPPPRLVSNGSSVDDRALKRHQRMIKNRESAFLSRVRKKEYVTSLEQQIDNLQQENQYLKNENIQLLEKLKLRCSCGATTIGKTTSFAKQITPTMRKNTAIVLAMLFMVSLNLGPLGNLLSSNGDRTLMESTPVEPHHQRSLLWLDEANKFNVDVDATANVTHFDEPPSRSSPLEDSFSVCPFYVNQTENIRLARELRRWIGENGFKNVTDRDGDDMSISSFSEMFALKDTIDSMYRQMKDISSQMETFKKRNKRAVASKKRIAASKKARELELYQQHRGKKDADLAFYYGGFGKKYAKFFEEIGRRDDTFYLVSFSGEHLLLPALAHNKTNRPKMSLMLPAVIDNGTHPTDKVTLMQIDCEVMNTSMIQIREKTIPGDLLRANPPKSADYPKQPAKRAPDQPTDDFVEHGVRNVSSSRNANGARKQLNREFHHHKHHAASRPFFVQRMDDHLKAELDLN